MKQAKILLVEDTDSVREVLTRQLEALGATVTALADGGRVKALLDKGGYDLVVADLQLPDCSGVDIARFARAQNCKVVLLSGETGLSGRLDVSSAGFDVVLSKPISLTQLQDVLARFDLLPHDGPTLSETKAVPRKDETGVLDIGLLEEQMGHLDESALKMLARFPDMMRPLLRRLVESAMARHFEETGSIAHSLKSAARSAGSMELGDLCEKIQKESEKNFVIRADTIATLQKEFARTEAAIIHLCHHH